MSNLSNPQDVRKFTDWLVSENKFSPDKAIWFYNTFTCQSKTPLTYEQMVHSFNEYQENHQKKQPGVSKPIVNDVEDKARKLGCKKQFPDCPKTLNSKDCARCPFFPKGYF
ncbi:MAG: hypothetical protein V1859_09375 [archaeon]